MARKALGRGLRALIPEPDGSQHPAGESDPDGTQVRTPATGLAVEEIVDQRIPAAVQGSANLRILPIDSIVPSADQPRQEWDPESLEDLAHSIAEKGLLEPIVVRPQGDHFSLVAGERRWRACKLAGWMEIPAIIRSFGEHESLEAALIENIQRADLNPVEEARAFETLGTRYGLTHEDIARRVGKDRSTVTNLLRILRLPAPVLQHVSRGTLTVGHVRVLLGVPERLWVTTAERIVTEGWSVRQVEEWASRRSSAAEGRGSARAVRKARQKPANLRRIEEDLCRHFGTEARIRTGRRGGRIELRFHSEEELTRLLDLFGIVVV